MARLQAVRLPEAILEPAIVDEQLCIETLQKRSLLR
jgi:hypothetical protein